MTWMELLNNFEWLRPLWLLALLPACLLGWLLVKKQANQQHWQNLIAPHLRPFMLQSASNTSDKWPIWLLLLCWVIATLALAGPSWQKVTVPAEKSQNGTVVVMDLSLSMLAEDLKPNRLNRMKYKMTDLVKQHPEMALGLVGYAGSAHTITPIAEDNQTLLNLLPSLSPVIMPEYGSEPLLAMLQADTLLQGSHIKNGHIIWFTDDIEAEQSDELIAWFKTQNHQLSIVMVGTSAGAPIHVPDYGLLKDDEGRIQLPKLPLQRFQALAKELDATLVQLSLNDEDLEHILASNETHVSTEKSTDKTNAKEVQHPLDMGIYLVWLLLPLAVFAFRKGWLGSFMIYLCLPLSLTTTNTDVFADNTVPNQDAKPPSVKEYKDPFLSHDQEGYRAWQAKDYAAAQALFKNPKWSGSAHYKNGDYAGALHAFKQDQSAIGDYNQANSLAHLGRYEEAIEAYKRALKKQPDLKDAQHNLSIVEQILKQQQTANSDNPSNEKSDKQQNNQNPQSSQANSNSDSQPGNQTNEPKQSQNQTANKDSNQDETKDAAKQNASKQTEAPEQNTENNSSAHNQPGNLNNRKNSESDEIRSAEKGQSDSEMGAMNDKTLIDENDEQTPNSDINKEQQRAIETWLQQIPNEPGQFLKRKFDYQYRQNQNINRQNTTRSKQDKIW